jgi:hypothetical protein
MLKCKCPGPPRRPARARLGLEALETRNLMTVSVGLLNGLLEVTGDNSGNTITVDHSRGSTIVNARSFHLVISGARPNRTKSNGGKVACHAVAHNSPTSQPPFLSASPPPVFLADSAGDPD